jgi:methylated-DNA-protein-cysteine methyltransferase-like protein
MSAKHKEAIYLALHHIPVGKVATYGQVASMANLPGAARLVGTTLRDLPEGSNLPWHRVINAQGKLSLPLDSPAYKEQARRLTAEGVEITRGKINLQRFGWFG